MTKLYQAIGRGATLVVAASNATALEKAQCDIQCSGVADNVKIQTAIDALTFGTIRLSSGIFDIQATLSIAGKFGLTIEGASVASGIDNNYAQAKYGTALTVDVSLTGAVIDITPTSSRVSLRNFRVQIDSTKQASGVGILNRSQAISLEHICIEGAKSHGFHNTDVGFVNSWGMANDLTCSNNGGAGICIDHGNDWFMEKVDTFQNALHGIWHRGASMFHVKNFNTYLNTLDGVRIDVTIGTNKRSWSFRDGSVNDNKQHGFNISGDPSDASLFRHLVLNNVVFFDNSQGVGVSGDYDNFHAWGYGKNITIENCIFYTAGTCYVAWHINFDANMTGVMIGKNEFISGTEWPNREIQLGSGTKATIKDNIGYIAPSEERTAYGALTAGVADTFTAWQNPESQAIWAQIMIEITTAAANAATLDAGSAANATTQSDNLIDGALLNATNLLVSSAWVKLDANGGATDYITMRILGLDAADVVARYYIKYIGV